jgi:hypothetical protein
VDSISNWAILNDTKSKQLERILGEFHHRSESEITLACVLLESYHAVYRRDRLMHRRHMSASGQTSMNRPCPPPTPTQLQEITQRVNAKVTLNLRAEEVTAQLQNLAECLQRYRNYVRESMRGAASYNQLNHRPKFSPMRSERSENNGHVPFLQMYPL